jgi:hypothetical protein
LGDFGVPPGKGSERLITQRSQVQILPPLRISGSESTDSEPESI